MKINKWNNLWQLQCIGNYFEESVRACLFEILFKMIQSQYIKLIVLFLNILFSSKIL